MRKMTLLVAVSLGALLSLSACTTGGDDREDARDGAAPAPDEEGGATSSPMGGEQPTADDLVGARWTGPDGETVPSEVLNVLRGPQHCDWQSSVLLHVGWPLGTAADTAADIRQYVRDPKGVLPDVVMGSFGADVQVPAGASATGYEADGVGLWLGEDGGEEAIYVVFEEHAERWPRTAEVIACA